MLSSWQKLAGTAGPQQNQAPDTRVLLTAAAHRQGFDLLELSVLQRAMGWGEHPWKSATEYDMLPPWSYNK